MTNTNVTTRSLPWAALGASFEDPVSSVEDALYHSGLDYEVEKFPMADWNAKTKEWEMLPDRFSIRRTDSYEYLGNVSKRYKPVQNREAFKFVDDIVANKGGQIFAAWTDMNGSKANLAVKMNEVEILDEIIEPYLICSTSHDGKGSVQAHVALFQMVCLNQLPSISRRATTSWSAVHSNSIEARMSQALSTLQLANDYTARSVVELEKLGNIPVSENKAENVCKRAIKKASTQMSDKNIERITNSILDIRETSDTLRDRYRPTGWGLLHAVTEYWDHYRTYRTETARYQTNGPTGYGRRCRNKVFELLTT